MLSIKQGSFKYYFFESLAWLNLGLNPGLLGHWQTLNPLVAQSAGAVEYTDYFSAEG